MPMITDWLMVGITFVYVVATIFICIFNGRSAKATRDQVQESQKQFHEAKRLEKIPYLQASIGEWIAREKRETLLPELWLNLTQSNNDNCASKGFSIELTNIGLGLLDNLKCTWCSDKIKNPNTLSTTLLQCNQAFSANAIVSAERPEQTIYKDGLLVFEFDDLLGNHYKQELIISFQIEWSCVKPIGLNMKAPVYIQTSQEVDHA